VNDLGPSLIFSSPLSDLGGDGVEFWQAIEAAYPPLTDRAGTTINVDGSLVAATSFDIDLAADFGGTITIVGGDSFPIFYYRWHDFGDLVNLTIFANGLLKLQFYFPRGGGEGLLWVGPNQSQEAFTESGQTVTVTPPAP